MRPSSYIYTSDNNIAELVGGIPTPLKNMSSSVGIIIPNIYIYNGKIKAMFQTTNQRKLVIPSGND